jgi:sugar O-acyltransferase (sialic acid O-acetyltransferase NeuD family)
MNKPSLILIGAGGHAQACIDVIEQQGQFDIAGLVGTDAERDTRLCGYPVIGVDADLPALAARYRYALITVGQIDSPALRMRLFARVKALGMQGARVVAPSAYVSRHALIGEGSIVMHGAIVNAGAAVGANCIINSRALVEHGAVVGDDCHIATGAILNGNVRVGAGSFVGSGSVVREGILLGKQCIIGMGQSVRHDQADHARTSAQR